MQALTIIAGVLLVGATALFALRLVRALRQDEDEWDPY